LDRSHRIGAGLDYGRSILKMTFLAEFWKFLSVRKKFWLLPLLIMTVLFGVLLIMAESTALAPFIYTLF